MTIYTTITSSSTARVEELRAEYGITLAARMIEAEAADFLWESRVRERYLGQHVDVGLGFGEDEVELSRIAILSDFDDQWMVALCLVDGEGQAVDLLWRQQLDTLEAAEAAFERAR